MNKKVFLPGLEKQINFLNNKINFDGMNCLIVGVGSSAVAANLYERSQTQTQVIIEDYNSLINYKLELSEPDKYVVKMMDFERTDYPSEEFDLIYAQASISDFRRKKIVKELKRILKPDGYVCIGEIIKLNDEVPNFVNDLFSHSNLDPLTKSSLIPFYEERNFELIDSIDLSRTLSDYYQQNVNLLKEKIKTLNSNEKSYYKKLLNQISHESNVYLNLGGDKYFGFRVLLLKKK